MKFTWLGALLWIVSAPAAEIKGPADTQWIEDAGGKVAKDAAGRITGVNLRASWVTDTDLRGLVRLADLTHLDLSLTRITDQGMQELKNLPGIVDLNLYYAEYVTDEGLAAVRRTWPLYARGIINHFARYLTDEEITILTRALGRVLSAARP